MKKIFYWRFSRKIEGEFWIFYKRFPWEKNEMEEIFKGISMENWSWGKKIKKDFPLNSDGPGNFPGNREIMEGNLFTNCPLGAGNFKIARGNFKISPPTWPKGTLTILTGIWSNILWFFQSGCKKLVRICKKLHWQSGIRLKKLPLGSREIYWRIPSCQCNFYYKFWPSERVILTIFRVKKPVFSLSLSFEVLR